ncbi:MAG: hypothetical protein AAB592_04760 [Patescibacteria group bacterium]
MHKHLVKKIAFLVIVGVLSLSGLTYAAAPAGPVFNTPVVVHDGLEVRGNSVEGVPGNLDVQGAIANTLGNLKLQDSVDITGSVAITGGQFSLGGLAINALGGGILGVSAPFQVTGDSTITGNSVTQGTASYWADISVGGNVESAAISAGNISSSGNITSVGGNITSALGTIGSFYNISCDTSMSANTTLAQGLGHCYNDTSNAAYKQIFAYCSSSDVVVACSGYSDGATNLFKGATPSAARSGTGSGCKAASKNTITTDKAYAYAFCFSPNG